jgi:hypothetical protein
LMKPMESTQSVIGVKNPAMMSYTKSVDFLQPNSFLKGFL